MLQKFPKPQKAREEEDPTDFHLTSQVTRRPASPLHDQIHLWFHDSNNLVKFLDAITDGNFDKLDGRPTPLFVYEHGREDGSIDDNSVYASKVELTDETVLLLMEKGHNEILQIVVSTGGG